MSSLKFRSFSAALLCVLLSACAGLYANGAATPAPTTGVGDTTGAPQATEETAGAIVLSIWLPPSFDPAGGDLAATMLQDRLAQFSEQHPQVRVEARVKAESGPGGLLDALLNAQQAAPLALPDLVLLPGALLPAAAQSGVLQAQEAFAEALDSDDWYPFAKQMANIENDIYGLPFAADAFIVGHRTTAISQVPSNWNTLLNTRIGLGFAAADPQANFTIAQLLALKGEDNAPGFEPSEADLRAVFELYGDGQARQVFPFWLTQYENPDQTWQAFTEGRLPMVAAWSSRVFSDRLTEVNGAPMPTQNGRAFAMMRAWLWAITATDPERSELATELADFLTTPEFLAQYTAAANLLPPRPSSLAAWTPDANQALASQIIADAVPVPDQATQDRWGAALSQAVIAILKQEATPVEAVEMVLAVLAAQ